MYFRFNTVGSLNIRQVLSLPLMTGVNLINKPKIRTTVNVKPKFLSFYFLIPNVIQTVIVIPPGHYCFDMLVSCATSWIFCLNCCKTAMSVLMHSCITLSMLFLSVKIILCYSSQGHYHGIVLISGLLMFQLPCIWLCKAFCLCLYSYSRVPSKE